MLHIIYFIPWLGEKNVKYILKLCKVCIPQILFWLLIEFLHGYFLWSKLENWILSFQRSMNYYGFKFLYHVYFFFSRFLIFISGWGLGTESVFIFLLCYRFHMCPPLYFFFSNWEWGLWRFTVILAKKLSRWLRKTSKTGWSPVLLKLLELLKLQKKKILLMLNESLKNSGNSKEEQYLKVKFCTLRRVTLGLLISCLWDSNRLQNVFLE